MNKPKFPIKTSVAIIFTIIWNALLIPNFLKLSSYEVPENYSQFSSLIPSLFLFIISITLILSTKFQKLFLRKESTFDDIKKYVYLVLLISVFLFLSRAI
tara:strand:+ start:481 stop:780 length:300 start_codon:yes stop_codon:yes gene_type:complete